MSKHLNDIIKRLGYADSPFLIYKSNNYNSNTLNLQTVKMLNVLSPYAAYMVKNVPFVLFFDEPRDIETQRDINRKLWNAQIPIAMFCGTSTVKIFSGYTLHDKENHLLVLAETLSISTINIDSPFSFFEITDQDFWVKYNQAFSGRSLNVDLLGNLSVLTDRLKNTYRIPFATKLVLRFIFIRYLIDRGVDLDHSEFTSDVDVSRKVLLSLLGNKSALYEFFTHLKDRFNGNLFEVENIEFTLITDDALTDIKDFLSANIVSWSNQLSLFDLYDFAIIPVELISNIYEILLGKNDRTETNAFYTPKYLVEYITNMTIHEHIMTTETCRILDPSCGSGVFLVDSYRQMVEKALCGEQYTEKDELLCSILTDNIFGIDLNPSAIDVAIFSLYLAVLDYKNPKTLKQFPLPNLKNINLFACDFFDEEKLLPLQQNVSFDFIIGNPPWGRKTGKHIDYCRKHGFLKYLQNNDTCPAFILRAKDFCVTNKEARCCFVLHSRMLYRQKQQSRNFRAFLLESTQIFRLIELSSVRKLIFKGSDAPAIILECGFYHDNPEDNRFEYISMKKNPFFHLFNIIVVEKNDVKYVQQKFLLVNDWAWKTLVYGLTGDIDTILELKSRFSTLEEYISLQTPPIIKGEGVQYHDGDRKDARHLQELELPLLNSRTAIEHFELNDGNASHFSKTHIHRPRESTLFRAPFCLVMRGVDMKDYTMKAVYTEKDYIFKHAIYAIKGDHSQKTFLLNIVGLLNSKAYAYLNLMLGSSIAIEREQRQMEEVLSFPFFLDDNIAKQVETIQGYASKDCDFTVPLDSTPYINALNQAIMDAFGLSNNVFFDYALRIQIPLLTGEYDKDATRKMTSEDFKIYGQYFYDYLSPIFSSSENYIQVRVYPNVTKNFSAVEVIVVDEEVTPWLTTIGDSNHSIKAMFAKFSEHKINDMFYALKDVLYFNENSFYIIKPNYYKNWHPAIAQLDLMEVTDQILSRGNGGINK